MSTIQIVISGIYRNPFGQPLTNVMISLVARYTSTSVFMGTDAASKTDENGAYTLNVVPGTYVVTSSHPAASTVDKYLGVIQVYPDSPAGTLNEYLVAFQTSPLTPAMLAEMEELLAEAKIAALDAEAAAAQAIAASILGIKAGDDTFTKGEDGYITLGSAAAQNVAKESGEPDREALMPVGFRGFGHAGVSKMSGVTQFLAYKTGAPEVPGAGGGIRISAALNEHIDFYITAEGKVRFRVSKRADPIDMETAWNTIFSELEPQELLPDVGKNKVFITDGDEVVTGTDITAHGKLVLAADYPDYGLFTIDPEGNPIFIDAMAIMKMGMGISGSGLNGWSLLNTNLNQVDGKMTMYCQPNGAYSNAANNYPFNEPGILVCWPYNTSGVIQNYITVSGREALRTIPDTVNPAPTKWTITSSGNKEWPDATPAIFFSGIKSYTPVVLNMRSETIFINLSGSVFDIYLTEFYGYAADFYNPRYSLRVTATSQTGGLIINIHLPSNFYIYDLSGARVSSVSMTLSAKDLIVFDINKMTGTVPMMTAVFNGKA